MIIGIGTDIVNIERIERILEKYGEVFLQKNFHQLEIERYNSLVSGKQAAYLAKRFAAKEAFAKALGSGIGKMVAFRDIAVINNDAGMPQLLVSADKIPDVTNYNIQISLSDDYPFAVAFVVITS